LPKRVISKLGTVKFANITKTARRGAVCLLLASAAAAQITISPDHPELLQQGILDAYAAGQKSVVIPAGIYRVPSANGIHLDLENLSNFEIDATGATLVFQDVTAAGVYFYNCTAVYFHGATVYYATPPFSQGVVQAAASDGSSIDVQIEPGYPTNLNDPTYFSPTLTGHIFDSTTRLWKKNIWGDVSGTRTLRLGPDTFRIFTTSFGGSVGDLIGIRPGTGSHIIQVNTCSLMQLSHLTILNSPLFGIADLFGGALGANSYTYINITRGNKPPNAATDPLFSTSADGFHSALARTGPYVSNCSFEYMADDGIAVHGDYSWVVASSGNSLIVSNTADEGAPNFQVGDTLRLVDPDDVPAGSAIVTHVTALPSYTTSLMSARPTLKNFFAGPYYQISLDRNLTAGFDYLADDPGESGSGFVLFNNTIRNNRARGIIVKGQHGTIQGNIIDGSTLDGIKAGPDFWWSEAGYVSNLVIGGNTINNVGYWGGGTAGIFISPDQGLLPPAGAFQNLTIERNTFSNFNVPAIFLTSASGVMIDNNIFTGLQNALPFSPNYVGQNVLSGVVVFVSNSSGVQLQGNTMSQPGPANSYFVEALPGSSVGGAAYVTPIASSVTDFSGSQGASNWYYGYFPSGNLSAFTLLPTYDATDARWQHVTYGPPWTSLWANSLFLPNGTDSGTVEWATRRWISTFTGPAAIVGHLAKTDTNPASTGIYGMIYLNQALVYQKFIQGIDGTGADYSVNAQFHGGDTVDFAVAPNGVGFDDGTQFTSTILSTTLLNQTISFAQPANEAPGTPPLTLAATATSGLPVSFASNTPAVCGISGNTVTLLTSGTCSITANQSGDATYAAAAPVTVSFNVMAAGGNGPVVKPGGIVPVDSSSTTVRQVRGSQFTEPTSRAPRRHGPAISRPRSGASQ
jgi:hypothetical protein